MHLQMQEKPLLFALAHCEKSITCFLAEKKRISHRNLLLKLLLKLVQSISKDRAERRGIHRFFSPQYPSYF